MCLTFSGSAGKHADSEPRRIFSVFSPSGLSDGAQLMLDVDSWDVLISLSVLCSDGRGRFGDGRSGGELLPPRGRSGGNCGEGLSDGRM